MTDEGICEFGPAGEVGGMMTMLLIPANMLPVIDGPWQSAQPLVIPVWSIFPPEKLVKLVSVDWTWQLPHCAPLLRGIWLTGIPVATRPSWQVAQVLVSPPSAVCGKLRTGVNAKVEWHTSHDKMVDIWVDDFPVALVPSWQVQQAPGPTAEWLKTTAPKELTL